MSTLAHGASPNDGRWLHRLVLLRPGELKPMLLSGAYFFFLLAAYYIMRPLRDALGISGELRNLPWLWTGTTAAMVLATPVFSALVSRLPRRRFIPLTYRFFALNILLFFALFKLAPTQAQLGIGYAFYIWLSVFNLFAVSVFWGFTADMYTHEQSKRLFGTIAIGGTLGAIFGSSIPATLARALGPANLLPISIILLELAVQCVLRLVRHFGIDEQGAIDTPPALRSPEPGQGVLKGIALVCRSPYLLLIALYMLLFSVTSTFLFFEQARVVKAAFTDAASRTAVLARIDVIVNILALFTQLFLTGRFITRLGIATALALLPVLTLGGFALLIAMPGLWPVLVFQVLRRSMHYAVDRPTREVLYTVLGPDEKYKSKSFIDTVVYRAGDLTGAWMQPLLSGLGWIVAAVAAAISATWLATALALAALHRRKLNPPPRVPRCASCGYILVGLRDPVCPECGRPVPPSPAQQTTNPA
jgi:AAA family ATP:ADP antiporter